MESNWAILSIPYGSSAPAPFWGAQTSHMNFCEEDYIVTHYVAEFFNTLTNLGYIGYGLHGIRRYKHQDVGIFSAVNHAYWGLIGIGVCSAVYHATLKYHTQMGDEMSMHLALGCVLIQVFNFQQPAPIQRRNTAIVSIGLTSFIIYHCVTDEFTLHVIIFVTLSLTVVWKTRNIIRNEMTDKTRKAKLGKLCTLGACTALFAYLLWNIDVHCCPTLTRWKRELGMPFGVLLELHGWWHVLTSISTYTFMAIIEFLTFSDYKDSHGIGFAWPAKAVLEDLVPKQVMNGIAWKGTSTVPEANGHVKGDAVKRRKR